MSAANLANSDGWNENRPREIHRRAPLTSTPTKYIATKDTAVNPIIQVSNLAFCNRR